MGQERHFGRPDPMSTLPPLPTAIATCRAVAKGQERPICDARATSALPPIATKSLHIDPAINSGAVDSIQ
jgi:hypothetical protein